jgi:hypothetical protein
MKMRKRPAHICTSWKTKCKLTIKHEHPHEQAREADSSSKASRKRDCTKTRAGYGRKEGNRGAVETLTDITNRSANLFQVYREKISSDDGYQVIDPKTVTATFQEIIPKAAMNPAPIIKEQISLCADLAMLWQRTSMRALFNMPAEPVIVPSKQDKRFKNEAWTENWYFDYVKQHYLLLSRCIESSVRGVKDVDRHTHHKAQFYTRQFVSAFSPTNFALTNRQCSTQRLRPAARIFSTDLGILSKILSAAAVV